MKKTKIIGILNLTNNSFYDGGKHVNINDAVNHVKRMIKEGADIIDIGAESTKPGFKDVGADNQLKKILPVIQKIKQDYNSMLISVDTRSSLVAKETLAAGASIINDVSSGTYDSKMMKIVSDKKAKIILTHMPQSHQTKEVSELNIKHTPKNIEHYFNERIEQALSEGIKKDNIIVDPGICYGKAGKDNIEVIKNIQYFVKTFKNVCLGVSNKKFSSDLFSHFHDEELNIVSLAVTTHCVLNNVAYVRVHDVAANRDALEVAWKTCVV